MLILHTVLIRYSLFLENSKGWVLTRNTRNDLDSYREQLFNHERLRGRLNLFKNFTIPGLAKQKLIEDRLEGTNIHSFQVFLATSQELPESHKQELETLADKYKWLNICYLPSKGVRLQSVVTDYIEHLYNDFKKPILYSSIRLDDDDALSVSFLDCLKPYTIEENIGRAITFANGYYGIYDSNSNRLIEICDYFSPKLALGLALINKYDENGYTNKIKTIYDAGNHTRIDRHLPVITDGRIPKYIRTVHNHADSHDEKGIQNIIRRNNLIHPIKVMKSIGIVFPASFGNLLLDITLDDIKKIRIHEFNLVNSELKINLSIQICVWKKNILIQLSKCNSEDQYIELKLRKKDNSITENSCIGSLESRIVIPLKEDIFNDIDFAEDSLENNLNNISTQPLFLDVKINHQNKLFQQTLNID